jgi:hypothetical protein
MSRLLWLAILAAALAACSDENYRGYGYAPNLRPTLSQLAVGPVDRDNPFRARSPAPGGTPAAQDE